MKEKLNNLISELKELRNKESKSSTKYENLDMCIDNLIDASLFLGMYYDEIK